MPTEAEIQAHYKQLHDELTESYYGGASGLTREQFDQQHGQIWSDMETALREAGYLPPPEEPLSFTPVNPDMGLAARVAAMEEFLERAYP